MCDAATIRFKKFNFPKGVTPLARSTAWTTAVQFERSCHSRCRSERQSLSARDLCSG